MSREKIDKFYEKQGIKVRFNTLGYNDNLIKTYVQNFKDIVSSSTLKKSHIVKTQCYNSIYNFIPRDKLTGFEQLKAKDLSFREKASTVVTESQFTPTLSLDNIKTSNNTTSYKDELKKSLTDLDNILMYLSGGIDSEFVARVLLEMKKPFTPVVFQWTNNDGKIVNEQDLKFAFKFCVDNDLSPIVKTINLENLWESTEFLNLAKDIQITSPQLLTYAHIVSVINSLYPNKTHLFGGEVRFYNKIIDNKESNIVFLNKVCPPAYDTQFYQGSSSTSGNCTLEYFASTGQWRIVRTGFSSVTGLWTTSPGEAPYNTYQYLIDSVTEVESIGPLGQIIPNVPTTWAPIDSEPTQICRVQIGSGSNTRIATFEIWVRSINDLSNICVSTVTLAIEGTL